MPFPPKAGWGMGEKEGGRKQKEGKGWLSRQELGDPALREAEGGL